MIGAFILIDMEKVHAFLRSLFPPHVRDDYDVIIAGIDRGLSGVIRGQLLICLINGIFTYIGLVIFDVKYQLILSLVAATMSLIPIFGSILSTIPIVLAALVSGDAGIDIARGVVMVAWIVGIHFIEANFLNPKIIGTAAKIHPVLVIFSLILGEKSYGLIGALFAVPVLSIISVVFMFFYRKSWKDGRMVTQALPTIPLPPPAAIIDGRPLFESAAICAAIADLVPERELIPPPGSWSRSLHEQWVLFALTEMEAWVWTAELNTLEYVFPKEKHVPAIVPQCRKLYRRSAAVLDAHFAEHAYLIEDRFTVADIIVGYTVNFGQEFNWGEGYPHLLGWLERLHAREHCTLERH